VSAPEVRPVGEVFDMDERRIEVGVDYDTVSIAFAGAEVRLPSAAAEEFGRLFISACWQAGVS
jgi:hypothetical protein